MGAVTSPLDIGVTGSTKPERELRLLLSLGVPFNVAVTGSTKPERELRLGLAKRFLDFRPA